MECLISCQIIQREKLIKIHGEMQRMPKILCGYLKAGIKAVRECTPKALVTLHLESMGYGKCSEIMNAWEQNGVDYDVFGSSFYQFWQGNSSKNALAGLQKNRKILPSQEEKCMRLWKQAGLIA